MDSRSISVMGKPLPHISLTDWSTKIDQLRNVGDARRADSIKSNETSRALRNEARIQSDWANYDTNMAMADRISEINLWRDLMTTLLERIEREMLLLKQEKDITQQALDELTGPIFELSEVLTMRDGRLGSELTYDDPDIEIKSELAILENNQRLLTDRCQSSWEKLNRLEETRVKINMNIENFMQAAQLDASLLSLEKTSSSITYKPDPTRIPKNSCTYEMWLDHVKNIKLLAENELADTYAIRESLFVCREKANSILKAQQDNVNRKMRKRIFETEHVRNVLQWERTKMKDQIERTVCEIKTLEQALRDKRDGMKLAQTRLENRAQRAGMELCTDQPHDMLCLEVEKLTEIEHRLIAQIEETKTRYNLLEEHVKKIDWDIENKEHALMLDTRALEIRTRGKANDSSPKDEPA